METYVANSMDDIKSSSFWGLQPEDSIIEILRKRSVWLGFEKIAGNLSGNYSENLFYGLNLLFISGYKTDCLVFWCFTPHDYNWSFRDFKSFWKKFNKRLISFAVNRLRCDFDLYYTFLGFYYFILGRIRRNS